jgi:beta-lactamase superfamily II metal-dependent hydrolase
MGYEIDFLPVGDSNGDAIVVRHGTDDSFYLHIVDGGFTDTARTVIDHVEKYFGKNMVISDMVLSHADNDHATGLVKLLDYFDVRSLWMNRPWLYAQESLDSFHGNYTLEGLVAKMKEMHPYLVELEAIAAGKSIPVKEIFQGAVIGPFRVLAPSRQRYIDLIPDLDKTPPSYKEARGVVGALTEVFRKAADAVKETLDIETLDDNPPATSASNETSVVQLGRIDSNSILLTADVGPAGLNEAADYAQALGLLSPPTVVQIPHHGSRRNVTPAVLNRWLGEPTRADRGRAYVSVGKDADLYPRKKVKNAFIRRGYTVMATRGKPICEFSGFPSRPGWVAAPRESFSEDVED